MKDKARVTSPISNHIGIMEDVHYRWGGAMASISHHHPDLVVAHKEKFGRQDYCLTAYRRYWVWEFEGYRVFVANGYGIGLEVETDLTDTEALEKLDDYIAQWPCVDIDAFWGNTEDDEE